MIFYTKQVSETKNQVIMKIKQIKVKTINISTPF